MTSCFLFYMGTCGGGRDNIPVGRKKRSLLLSLRTGNELLVRHDSISFQHSQLLHSLLPQQVPWPNLEALPAHGCVDGITEAWMGGLEEEGEERRDVRLRYGQSLGGLVRKGHGGTEGTVRTHNLLPANEQLLLFLIIFNFLNWYLASLCGIDTFHMWHVVHRLELVLVSLRCWELKTWPSQSSFFNLTRIQISSAFLKDRVRNAFTWHATQNLPLTGAGELWLALKIRLTGMLTQC